MVHQDVGTSYRAQSHGISAVLPLQRNLRSILAMRLLASCLMFVLMSQMPARADHVHHLYYNNLNWTDQDLTAATGGGIATSFGAITAVYTTPNDQLHVYYVDTNTKHVHQLYFNGTNWSDSDLTAFTGGPTASPYGISAFAIKNLQYVFYDGSDNHIHQLTYNNVNWTDQDVTGQAASVAAGAGPIVAFDTTPNHQFHVYYQPFNSTDLHQLFFNGSFWSDTDLTAMLGANCYSDWIAGFAVQNVQHIFCPGYGAYSSELHMMHIYYNNSSWVYEDVSYNAGGAENPMALGSGVAAFRVPGTSKLEAYGVTYDSHVHQYTFKNKKWSDLDLTASEGAPGNGAYGGMAAFATTPNKQFHAYYQPSSDVYQLFYSGTGWASQDLTGGFGQADDNSGMSGFAIGNLQHVFYLSFGN